MKDIEKGKNLEVTVNELVEEYSWLITESIVKSFKKQGRFAGNTKKSIKKSLEQNFEGVEYIAGKKNQKAKFILTNYNGNTEVYNPYKNNSRPSLDWTNELLVIRELINQEVTLGSSEKLYRGFTVNQLFEKMIYCNKYKIEAIVKDEVSKHRIFTLGGKQKEDEYGLRDTVNNLVRNQKKIYTSLIEKEIKKTSHKIDYLDSNGNKLDVETYEEYESFKNKLTKELKAENEKIRDKRNQAYREGLNIKDLPKAKTVVEINGEVENAVREKFQFKYAYKLFNVFHKIQIDGKGDITKQRKNFYNRIMKNANSSQSKYEKTEEINYSETVFYRLVHSHQYFSIMKSIFTKLIDIESKMIDTLEEDPEELQRHLDNVELYMAEQQQEQEEEFYNQDIYIDVERILYEMENPLTDEECEERCLELFEY